MTTENRRPIFRFRVDQPAENMSEGNFFSSSVRSSSNTVSSSSLDTQGQGGGKNTWLDSINSPLIQEDGDGKSLKLRFDVSQYQPEEIVVKTVDNKLLVS